MMQYEPMLPASVFKFRPATGRNGIAGRRLLLASIHYRGHPGMVSGPGETLGVRATRQAPHSRATLAATTQGPSPAGEKSFRSSFADTVCRCRDPAIEDGPRPVLGLLKTPT